MVSWEMFVKVQHISNGTHAVPHRKMRGDFPLRGYVRCPSCHYYLTASFCQGRSQRYPYYHCEKQHCSNGSAYTRLSIHQEFARFLAEIAPTERTLSDLRHQLIQVARDWRTSERAQSKRIESEATSLRKQLQELIAMRSQSLITDKEFILQKNVLSRRLSAITSNTANEGPNEAQISSNIEEITAPLLRLPETWNDLQIQPQRRFQELLLPAGYIHGEIGTANLGHLFSLIGRPERLRATAVASNSAFWNQLIDEIRVLSSLFEDEDDQPAVVSAA